MVYVKICGITEEQDALACVAAGADAIGLNFFPGSPRCVSAEQAKRIVAPVAGKLHVVGVFVDASVEQVTQLRAELGLDCVQFHGNEPPEVLEAFLPHAYRALRVRDEGVLAEAARFGGDHVLLDAYVPGVLGGSGARFDWSIAAALALTRKVTLAGGLTPDNVREAVQAVRPYAVDVASGVESKPGRKDPERVRLFVERAKQA